NSLRRGALVSRLLDTGCAAEDVVVAACARCTSRSITRPPGPDPTIDVESTSCSAANRLALGLIGGDTLSPGFPMMQSLVKTGTTAPSSTKISSTVPATGAVTSKVVLSVSISATTSPADTDSPLRLIHRVTRHSSTVLPSLGSSTGVAIYSGFGIRVLGLLISF